MPGKAPKSKTAKPKAKQKRQVRAKKNLTNSRPIRQPTAGRLLPTSIAFLKAATSGPDFASTGCRGVPDDYGGKSVVINDYVNFTLTPPSDSLQRTVIIQCPVPGVAFWHSTFLVGADGCPTNALGINFTPVYYASTKSLYHTSDVTTASGVKGNTDTVDRFRMIGNQLEIQSMNNSFNWSGKVTTFRAPLHMTTSVEPAPLVNDPTAQSLHQVLTGMKGVFAAAENGVYTAPMKDGAYIVALNDDTNFAFSDVRDYQYADSHCEAGINTVIGPRAVYLVGAVNGFGSMATNVMWVDVPTGATAQILNVRAWSVYEAIPTKASILDLTSGFSAPNDPVALEVYKAICQSLPPGVPWHNNAGFWAEVLRVARSVTSGLSYVPGVTGIVSGALNTILKEI